jgi:hypothetical protein
LTAVLLASSLTLCMGRSYLGCFELARWQYSYKAYAGNWTVDSCSAKCETMALPLVGLGLSDTACMCSTYTPNGGAQLEDVHCRNKTEGSLALYYYKVPSGFAWVDHVLGHTCWACHPLRIL